MAAVASPAAQPSATAERGEHELALGGVTYLLRPSHKAMKAIERKTDRSIMDLFRAGNTGSLSQEQLGIIAGALIRAGAEDDLTRRVDDERIGELIYEAGTHKAMARLTLCLIDAASGGRTASGEAKADPEGTKEIDGDA